MNIVSQREVKRKRIIMNFLFNHDDLMMHVLVHVLECSRLCRVLICLMDICKMYHQMVKWFAMRVWVLKWRAVHPVHMYDAVPCLQSVHVWLLFCAKSSSSSSSSSIPTPSTSPSFLPRELFPVVRLRFFFLRLLVLVLVLVLGGGGGGGGGGGFFF